MPENEVKTQATSSSKLLSVLENTSGFIDKVIEPIDKVARYIRYVVLALMVLTVTANVLVRYFSKSSITGTIEIQEFALIIVVFLTFLYIEKTRSQISVDIVSSRLSNPVRSILENNFYLFISILFTLISWNSVIHIMGKSTEFSSALKLPISIFIAIAAFGLILMTLTIYNNFLRSTIEIIKNKKTPFLLITLFLGLALLLLPNYVSLFSMAGLPLGGLIFLLLFSLMFLGMPIGYAMMLAGYIGLMMIFKDVSPVGNLIGITPYRTTASYLLAVLPMFILMGSLAFFTGLSEGLFNAANKWLGRLPGGLAIASIAGCAGFGAICGDSLATAMTMSKVALPEMQKKNYHPSIATGSLAAGGTLGILIPPSIGFIIYALLAEESVGKLFISGIIPGIILALLFIVAIYLIAKRRPDLVPRGESYKLRERFISLKGVIPIILLFTLIIGGILLGFFTPNEGGAIGCVGAIIIALASKKLSRKILVKSLDDAILITARLFLIIIGVGVFGYFLAATKVPFLLADFITGLDASKYIIFAAICVLYIILGSVMNVIPMMMLTLPSLLPTVWALGFDPIWFGVILVILMEMGQITPPIGMIVFAMSSTADMPVQTIFKGVWPFVVCMLILIVILTFLPQLALFLPNLLM